MEENHYQIGLSHAGRHELEKLDLSSDSYLDCDEWASESVSIVLCGDRPHFMYLVPSLLLYAFYLNHNLRDVSLGCRVFC